MVAGAAGAAFLFYLIFMVWIPPVEATSLAVAAVGTGLSPAATPTAVPSTAPKKEPTWSSWYSETRASINVGKWSTVSVAIFATILSFIGFLGGMLIQ